MNKIIRMCILLLFSFLTAVAHADDAAVLPKGVSAISVNTKFYFPITERYNPDGDVEDVATDYNAQLDSNVFGDLGLLETTFKSLGLVPPDFVASFGNSNVSFKYNITIVDLFFARGITDKLTIGIHIPYWWMKNNVDARLNTSAATVGKNPLLGNPSDPFGAPFIPISVAESMGFSKNDVQLTTEDIKQILINNFGYKRFETWSDNGVGDIEAGVKYQYLKKENWQLAFTGGVRFPTGRIDDQDNLVDYPFGSGAYALLFRLHNDYTGIKNLVLNTTFRYDLLLKNKETLRVTENVNQPITANKEEVKRDLGDVIELEASGAYDLSKGFNLALLYKYGLSLKDKVEGSQGRIQSLESETDYTEHVFVTSLSYTTVPLYLEKKSPVPLAASLSYRNRFAGTNNVLKSQYIGIGLQFFF